MNNYLSIGDLAKIKGITPKCLRYYEQLGILIPAYTNPETGYRYYTNDQLVIVDLILTCIDFGIPLRQFKTYITEQNNINLEKLLEDGSRIVDEKIKNLLYKKEFLRDMWENVERSDRIKTAGKPFTEKFPQRYFLITPATGDFSNYHEISMKYSKLFYQCRSLDSSDGFNQGVIFLKEGGKLSPNAFLQVSKPPVKQGNLYTVPEGEYKCRVVTYEELCSGKYGEEADSGLIIKELFELTVSPRERLFEVQMPLEG